MAAQVNDKIYAERQGIPGTITVGDIIALSPAGGAPKWLDIIVGASSSSFNATIATGTVVNYVYAGVTYFRLIPSGIEKEAFYNTFANGILSGLVNYKIQ